jgi:outer membrane protein assembly factor BamE (lipoprotein component of BamABCDE complex)
VFALLLVGYVTFGLLRPGGVAYDPELLGALHPGMTRQEVETTLGRPLTPQMGRRGIVVPSNRPNRSSTPGLMEEEGLDLYFDEHGILRELKGCGFVRSESLAERIRRQLGL